MIYTLFIVNMKLWYFCSHRRIVQFKTAYYSFYLPVKLSFYVLFYLLCTHLCFGNWYWFNWCWSAALWKVACALLLSGESLENYDAVENILVEMGTYFQVQVTPIFATHYDMNLLAATTISLLSINIHFLITGWLSRLLWWSWIYWQG